MISYVYSTHHIGKLLGVSDRTVSRAAKAAGVGTYLSNGRLVGIMPDDIPKVRSKVHGVVGRPPNGTSAKSP